MKNQAILSLTILTAIFLWVSLAAQLCVNAKTVEKAIKGTPIMIGTKVTDLDDALENGSDEFRRGFEACQSQF